MCVFCKVYVFHLFVTTFTLLQSPRGDSHALACPKGGSVEFYNGVQRHDKSIQFMLHNFGQLSLKLRMNMVCIYIYICKLCFAYWHTYAMDY